MTSKCYTTTSYTRIHRSTTTLTYHDDPPALRNRQPSPVWPPARRTPRSNANYETATEATYDITHAIHSTLREAYRTTPRPSQRPTRTTPPLFIQHGRLPRRRPASRQLPQLGISPREAPETHKHRVHIDHRSGPRRSNTATRRLFTRSSHISHPADPASRDGRLSGRHYTGLSPYERFTLQAPHAVTSPTRRPAISLLSTIQFLYEATTPSSSSLTEPPL